MNDLYSKQYSCPDITVENEDKFCTCYNCNKTFTIDRDADFENGRWVDNTKLYKV